MKIPAHRQRAATWPNITDTVADGDPPLVSQHDDPGDNSLTAEQIREIVNSDEARYMCDLWESDRGIRGGIHQDVP